MKKYKYLFYLIIFLAFFLRFFKLPSFPPALYSDEVALGYNAYSLLKTGRDEFGNFFPLTLRSFGDYKPPLSSWAMIPFIYLFGLNSLSIRLPFALAGFFSIIVIYFLSLEIFSDHKRKKFLGLLAAVLLAISPWHLNQTRSAMLVGLEGFFNLLGVYLFIKGLKKTRWLFLSSISFSLAVYAYYGSRITAPLIIFSLLLIFGKRFFSKKKCLVFLSGFFLILPLFLATIKDPETLLGRARFMSIFYDDNVSGQLWEAKTLDGANFPPLLTRFFHNKPFYYFKDVIRRWLQHFEWGFLIVKGASVAPFQIPNMGIIYPPDYFFLLVGLFYIVKKKNRKLMFLALWFLVAPVVSAFTFMTPATNRSFNMAFPLYMIGSFGLVSFVDQRRLLKKQLFGILFTFYFLLFSLYLYQYYHSIPYNVADKWSYGRKELTEKVVAYQDDYEKVILTTRASPPYIFLLFYQAYDPREYWKTMRISPYVNELGWEHIDGFAEYEMPRDVSWEQMEKKQGFLYVSYQEEVADVWQEPVNGKELKAKMLDKIFYPSGEVAFKIFELQEVD